MNEEAIMNMLVALQSFAVSYQVMSSPKLLSNLKTTLKKYILPRYNAGAEVNNLDACLARLSVRQFVQYAEIAFEEQVEYSLEQKSVQEGAVRNYRSALNRFLSWMLLQDWYLAEMGVYDNDYCPNIIVRGVSRCKDRKGKGRFKTTAERHYGLHPSQFTPLLQRQFEAGTGELNPEKDFSSEVLEKFSRRELPNYGLHYFCTATEVPKRQTGKMVEKTYKNVCNFIRLFLGWRSGVEGYALESLSIDLMANQDLLEEFVAFGINSRGNGYGWAVQAAKAAIVVAKWLHHRRSISAEYQDIQEINLLRNYQDLKEVRRKKEPSRLNLKEKWLTFPHCKAVIGYLKQCCAPKYQSGHAKPGSGLLFARLRYMAISILTYCPVRQRELIELELGKTLFREQDCYWVKLSIEGHKEGPQSGKGREYPLPLHMTEEIDEWLTVWRPKFNGPPEYKNLFFVTSGMQDNSKQGLPFSTSGFCTLVSTAMYTATAALIQSGHPLFRGSNPKRTTPHDFRRITISWQREHGNPDQREALAKTMGHSLETADKIYNQLATRDYTQHVHGWWDAKVAGEAAHQPPLLYTLSSLTTPLRSKRRIYVTAQTRVARIPSV